MPGGPGDVMVVAAGCGRGGQRDGWSRASDDRVADSRQGRQDHLTSISGASSSPRSSRSWGNHCGEIHCMSLAFQMMQRRLRAPLTSFGGILMVEVLSSSEETSSLACRTG
jgi:hypothetical protein